MQFAVFPSPFINRNNNGFFFSVLCLLSTIAPDTEDRVVNYTAGFIVNTCMYLYVVSVLNEDSQASHFCVVTCECFD